MTENFLENDFSKNPLMLDLAHCLAGAFSNQKQAFLDPKNYAHIHVFFRPLPVDFFAGIGFYSEQVYDHDWWSPYRQGVHRFIDQGEQIYIENYSLKDRIIFAGAGHNLDILKSITPNDIERRYHCSMVFYKTETCFRGEVEGTNCLIEKNGCKTYLISEVELTEKTFVSLDRGLDVSSHQQVWGSTMGPLRFEKRQSYANEVPLMVSAS